MANKYIKKKQETLKDQELLKSANELGIDLNKANTDPEYWNNMMDGNIEDLGGSGLAAANQSLDGTVTALMKNAMIPAGYSSGNPIYIGGSRKEITAKDIVEPDTSTAMADTWMDESIASPRHNQSGTITANEDRLKSGEVQTQSNKKVAEGIVNSASGSTVAVEKRGHTTTEGETDDNKPKLNNNAPNYGYGKKEQDEEEEVDEKKYKDFFQKKISLTFSKVFVEMLSSSTQQLNSWLNFGKSFFISSIEISLLTPDIKSLYPISLLSILSPSNILNLSPVSTTIPSISFLLRSVFL